VTLADVMKELKERADPDAVGGMMRYGIKGSTVLGVRLPDIRRLARRIGRNRALAAELWRPNIRETRILASMIDDPARVTEPQMERWIRDFGSWEVTDQVCMNLFWRTRFAYAKAFEWAEREREFEKRAGFALMAVLAWKDKRAPDLRLAEFLPVAEREASDGRNYVRKAVSWAVRQIGKRSKGLRRKALAAARRMGGSGSAAARWVARDVLRELEARPAAGGPGAKKR
jgi:3-methyladenine DNA glycosylase AlkD